MDDIPVRAAVPGDLAGLLALYRHLHPTEPPPDPAAAQAAWTALLGSGLTKVLVAEHDGRLVACCTLAIVPNLTRGARAYAMIENVVTDPAYRRRGLGNAVLQAALQHAEHADCYKVVLATGSRNPATLRFYENAGFTRGGKTYFELRRP